jgi:hypothetical protein
MGSQIQVEKGFIMTFTRLAELLKLDDQELSAIMGTKNVPKAIVEKAELILNKKVIFDGNNSFKITNQ